MPRIVRATSQSIRVVVTGLDHPEGLNFSLDGNLYAGGEAGQVYRIDPVTGACQQYASTGGFLLGVALDRDANLYGCDAGRKEVVRISPAGQVSCYSEGIKGKQLVNPNYPVFDSQGNLYYTDSGDYLNPPTGSILVARPSGVTELLHPGPLHFPNGLAIDPEEQFLYVAMSTSSNVLRLPLNEKAARMDPEVWLELPDSVPDGLAFDTEGRLIIACYRPDQIYVAEPNEKNARVLLDDPGAELLNRPTNVALKDGFIYFANLGGWHIGAFHYGVKEMPLRYPILPTPRS